MSDLIQVRKGTSAQWAAANPILAEGEPGFDTTSDELRIGDGVSVWSSLTPPTNSRYVTVATAWTAVTYTNSWVDFDAGRPVQYRKIGDIVYLRGMAKSGTVGAGTPMFTLPTGFRTPQTTVENYPCISNSVFGFIQIGADGTVSAVSPSSNVWVSLAGLQFSTVA